ncbi:FAD-dependent oxidoreductase, partial [Rhizobium sp. BR5]
KNIGTTHITNGCYRLHPVEWNIGEVAGMLAAYCL